MITLLSNNSVSGIAGTANVITYSFFGDTITAGVDSFGVIAQGTLSAVTSTLVPTTSASNILIKTITLANTSASSVANIKLYVNGTGPSNQIISLALGPNGSATFGPNGWDVYDSAGSKLNFGLNGRGIVSVVRTTGNGAAGTTDTYTITYTDNTTSTFNVTNGANGTNGTNGTSPNAFTTVSGNTGSLTADNTADTLTITGSNGITTTASDATDTVTIAPTYGTPGSITLNSTAAAGTANTFARSDHTHGITAATPVALNTAAAEGSSSSFARADHVHPYPTAAQVGAASLSFTTISVSGQTAVVADSTADTLTFAAGTGITITTDAAADTVTIASTVTAPNTFRDIAVSGQTTVSADTTTDTLTLVAGSGIQIATDAAADSITISSNINVPNQFQAFNIGTTPTPTVLTADLAADTLNVNAGTGITLTADAGTDTFTITNAAPDQTVSIASGTGISVTGTYPSFSVANTGVTSVNGQSGAITIPVGTAVTRTSATASASTAVTTIQSYPVATGEITAGSEYEFYASLRVINTITATNAVVTLSVGVTNVLVLTQAIGTTAAAAPGAAVELYGSITFYSATAAEATIRASKQAAAAFDAMTNTSASVTVAAATATTIDLKFNTSGATSTFIARQATIRRVK